MHYPKAKANDADQKGKRKELRANATVPEILLWKALRGKKADGLKFRRQQGIGHFILDFYCPELRLCVELDGSSHDYKYDYDQLRSSFLTQQGIITIRFSNEEVFANLEGVVDEIIRVANAIKSGGK